MPSSRPFHLAFSGATPTILSLKLVRALPHCAHGLTSRPTLPFNISALYGYLTLHGPVDSAPGGRRSAGCSMFYLIWCLDSVLFAICAAQRSIVRRANCSGHG